MKALRSASFLLLATVGCNNQRPITVTDILRPSTVRILNVQEELDKAIADSKSIRFLSWNGHWIGTDCDADIVLRPGGKAVLTEYGDGVEEFKGTYAVGDASELTLSLTGYVGRWPAMDLYRDGSDLLLAPRDGSMDFIFGGRGGATVSAGNGSFWPFRQVGN